MYYTVQKGRDMSGGNMYMGNIQIPKKWGHLTSDPVLPRSVSPTNTSRHGCHAVIMTDNTHSPYFISHNFISPRRVAETKE